MKKSKLFWMLIVSIICVANFSVEGNAAAINLKINTLAGKVFQDSNRNGNLDLNKIEIGIKGQSVSLFSDLTSAEQNINQINTVITNSLGDYSFKKLKKGTYYLRYSSNLEKYKIPSENNLDYSIVEVKVDNMISTKNLPLNISTDFNVVPFVDTNWNGKKEDDEILAENKSFIIFNIDLLKKAIDNGTLSSIDTGDLISDVFGTGNIDLADGVYIRTAKSQNDIKINNADSGLYVILRSPVNFTLSDILKERQKLELLISILTNGDYQKLLDNPELFAGSDINTNNPNAGVTLLANTIQELVNMMTIVDSTLALKNEKLDNVVKIASQIENILKNVPSFRIGMLDYFGNMYDLTGMKIRKTNTFYFGIREFAKVEVNVYYDKNSNGKQDLLEFSSYDGIVNLLDEHGEVIESMNTTSKSGQVTFNQLEYNKTYFVEVVADRAITSIVPQNELPLELQGRSITNQVYFDSNYLTNKISQKIGVIGNNIVHNNITIDFPDDSLISFRNIDKKTNYSVVYYVNDKEPMEIFISKNDTVTLDIGETVDSLSAYLKFNSYLIPISY